MAQHKNTYISVIIFGLRFAFFRHIFGKKRSFKICALKRNDFRQLKRSIFQSGEVQNRGEFIKVLE